MLFPPQKKKPRRHLRGNSLWIDREISRETRLSEPFRSRHQARFTIARRQCRNAPIGINVNSPQSMELYILNLCFTLNDKFISVNNKFSKGLFIFENLLYLCVQIK